MLAKISHWVQIISGVVLVLGVILVVWQIRQTDQIANAQLTAEWFNQRASLAASSAGENPMRSFAKLCEANLKLSYEDALVLHSLFLQRWFAGMNARAVSAQMDPDSEFWKQIMISNMNLVVATPQGRAWFNSLGVSPEIVELVSTSPYYTTDCSELGPISALMRSDQEVKGASPGLHGSQ